MADNDSFIPITEDGYFSESEISCNHCGVVVVDPVFLQKMNNIRRAYGKPIHITSWYRCPTHDKEIGGKGNHPQGKAADIVCDNSADRFALVGLAIEEGITRIGVGKTFMHFDISTDRVRKVMWLYA